MDTETKVSTLNEKEKDSQAIREEKIKIIHVIISEISMWLYYNPPTKYDELKLYPQTDINNNFIESPELVGVKTFDIKPSYILTIINKEYSNLNISFKDLQELTESSSFFSISKNKEGDLIAIGLPTNCIMGLIDILSDNLPH